MRATKEGSSALSGRVFDVQRDSTDFRDLIFRPDLRRLRRQLIPDPSHLYIRDQETEGACTGFGLAAVIDFINARAVAEGFVPRRDPVSSRMLYEMARKYDQWPGEEYDGSSARGAMKGWHKHGVCAENDWEFVANDPGTLDRQRQQAALANPLGAYFRLQRRRSDLHAALNEVGALFASAQVHVGWGAPENGVIRFEEGSEGGHAFAIVGYTEDGFLIQNSWGRDWGGITLGDEHFPGVALWTYEDCEQNLMDVWVAQMALPVTTLASLEAGTIAQLGLGPERVEKSPPRHEIELHFLHIDDGQYDPEGNYSSSQTQAEEIARTAARAEHVLLYAHGGLNSVKGAAARAGAWRDAFGRNGIHEVHFIWETGLLAELKDVLFGKRAQVEELVGGFFSNWWDRRLEKWTWPLGRPLWKEMQSDAEIAFHSGSGDGTSFLKTLLKQLEGRAAKVHLVGHSAGAIWLAHLVARWRQLNGGPIDNLVLFAPACTQELFESHFGPAFRAGDLDRFTHFLLDDATEKDDDVAEIYRKSLLYLVSNSYEKTREELNGPGLRLLGMQRFQDRWDDLYRNFKRRVTTHIAGRGESSASTSHGGFDNDRATMNTLLATILGHEPDPEREFTEEEMTGY